MINHVWPRVYDRCMTDPMCVHAHLTWKLRENAPLFGQVVPAFYREHKFTVVNYVAIDRHRYRGIVRPREVKSPNDETRIRSDKSMEDCPKSPLARSASDPVMDPSSLFFFFLNIKFAINLQWGRETESEWVQKDTKIWIHDLLIVCMRPKDNDPIFLNSTGSSNAWNPQLWMTPLMLQRTDFIRLGYWSFSLNLAGHMK